MAGNADLQRPTLNIEPPTSTSELGHGESATGLAFHSRCGLRLGKRVASDQKSEVYRAKHLATAAVTIPYGTLTRKR